MTKSLMQLLGIILALGLGVVGGLLLATGDSDPNVRVAGFACFAMAGVILCSMALPMR